MMAPEEGALLDRTIIPEAPLPKGPQVSELSEQTATAGWLMVEHRALERERKNQNRFLWKRNMNPTPTVEVTSFFTFLL